jgi:uroporphyrin-III C-methyltransferase
MTLPAAAAASQVVPGKVYLVGAGPGDPELLTIKAARLIGAADTIVYDHLIGKGILALARPDVELVYAGKKASNHTLPQEDINHLLVRLAQENKSVVRLKGGDPFIFGRGGEEIEELASAGIPFEVVPGITAAAGCAAYGGFPLTHRDHAQVLVFATGHLKNGSVDLDWPALARPKQTVVFYMGIGGAKSITEQMMAHGLPGDTPAAVVQNGTTGAQRTIVADLATLATIIVREKVSSPALIVVGSVVTLHDTLNWFANRH